MSRSPTPAARLVPLLLAVAILATAAACRGGSSGTTAGSAAAPGPRRYTVRAEVVKLPEAGGPRQVSLRHEAIDDFANAEGAVVGMNAMVMPFDLAPELSLDGVAVGDKVEVTFAVDWSRPSMQVERLARLPPDTALTFGKARAAGAAAR